MNQYTQHYTSTLRDADIYTLDSDHMRHNISHCTIYSDWFSDLGTNSLGSDEEIFRDADEMLHAPIYTTPIDLAPINLTQIVRPLTPGYQQMLDSRPEMYQLNTNYVFSEEY